MRGEIVNEIRQKTSEERRVQENEKAQVRKEEQTMEGGARVQVGGNWTVPLQLGGCMSHLGAEKSLKQIAKRDEIEVRKVEIENEIRDEKVCMKNVKGRSEKEKKEEKKGENVKILKNTFESMI